MQMAQTMSLMKTCFLMGFPFLGDSVENIRNDNQFFQCRASQVLHQTPASKHTTFYYFINL